MEWFADNEFPKLYGILPQNDTPLKNSTNVSSLS